MVAVHTFYKYLEVGYDEGLTLHLEAPVVGLTHLDLLGRGIDAGHSDARASLEACPSTGVGL